MKKSLLLLLFSATSLGAMDTPPFNWEQRMQQIEQEINQLEARLQSLQLEEAKLQIESQTLLSEDWEEYIQQIEKIEKAKKQMAVLEQEIDHFTNHHQFLANNIR